MKMNRENTKPWLVAMDGKTIRVLSMLLIFLFCLLLTAFAIPGTTRAVSAIDGFDPNADGYVYSIAVQPDGKFL